MGDDLSLPERSAVRTAMQWDDSRNAGFSTADPDELPRPVITRGQYRASIVNVEAQRRDPDSLLRWLEEVIRTRKRCPEIGNGAATILEAGDDAVFAHVCAGENASLLAVHNLSDREVTATVDTSALDGEEVVSLLDGYERKPLERETRVELGRYGFAWLRIE